MKKWTMPEWMEKYRDSIVNTGGINIEDLMNDYRTSVEKDPLLAMLIIAVKNQVQLLETLHKGGDLK